MIEEIEKIMGGGAKELLTHECTTIPKDMIHLPGPDFVERIFLQTDRPAPVLRNLQSLFDHGRLAGLINSGGASGENDLQQAVLTAVINKRAGGMGLISGRKAFQKPMKDGVELLNAIQDVYLSPEVTIA